MARVSESVVCLLVKSMRMKIAVNMIKIVLLHPASRRSPPVGMSVLDYMCIYIYYTRIKTSKESDVGMLLTGLQALYM